MIVNAPEKFTAREYEEIRINQEEAEKNRQFQLEMARIEHSWNQLLRLPLALIALPVRLVQAIALCVIYARGKEPSPDFWKNLKF